MGHLRNDQTNSHGDRLAKMTPGASHAGVNVRNVTTVQTNAALPTEATPQTVNSDGMARKPTVPAIMGQKTPVSLSGGPPKLPGADRSRSPAVAPASPSNGDFVPVADLGSGIGVIEHLQAHGISPGVHNGILCVARTYAPAAKNLIAQLTGGGRG